ncbi:MAG TPA: DinB family protein [Dongiaceae bacterium]|nr:DinB family protein [Dongiaceae bacterium]
MIKRNISEISEPARLADQLHRAFHGDAWHGPSVLELLEDVNAAKAAAKPLPEVHSMWELLLHIEAWDRAGLVRLRGKACRLTGTKNFPRVPDPSDAAWSEAIARATSTHDELVKAVAALPKSRLRDQAPGKRYDFYHMLHGIAQHELYHAGQMAILKKAVLTTA